MILPPQQTVDSIGEVLTKIIDFTQMRQQIIINNIHNTHNAHFVPKDLPVKEFSSSLNGAINEYILSRRLLFSDTENIRFGKGGSFKVKAEADNYAKQLHSNNPDEYFEFQIYKLLENSLNQRVAAELLKQKTERDFSF